MQVSNVKIIIVIISVTHAGKIVWKVIKTSCTKVVSSSWKFKKVYKTPRVRGFSGHFS